MLEIFQYDFMVRAFLAGLATAVLAPAIGTHLVVRRYSFLADTLSHVSLAGIAIGSLLRIEPLVAAMGLSALSALCVEWLRASGRVLGDAGLSLFLSGGLAAAAVFLSLSQGSNVNLSALLFGSVTTVTAADVRLIVAMGVAVLALLLLFARPLLAISLDEELAAASGVPVRTMNAILVILAAVTVSLSMRTVGVLLVSALMVIPVLSAMQWKRSFRETQALAILFALLSVVAGLTTSFYVGLPSGPTIVLCAVAVFLGSSALRPR